MNSIDDLLDHVDEWKFKLHHRLKRMTPVQRKAYWAKIREQARAGGLRVVEVEKKAKGTAKRARRTG